MFLINPYAFSVAGGDFESIATVTVGSGGAASAEFTSIPATYQHLQIRYIARGTQAANSAVLRVQINADTGSNYATHGLVGGGPSAAAGGAASQAYWDWLFMPAASRSASIFGAGVIDILDYVSTSKNTTGRGFGGYDSNGAGYAELDSGLWMNTAAITSVKILATAGNWTEHSTFALYGVKAP